MVPIKISIKKTMAAVLACACILMCGCTKSTIIDHGDADAPQPGMDGIVWEQLWEDWGDAYEDKSTYPFADTVNCSVYSDQNRVEFYLLLDKAISEEKAVNYAMEAVKGFGDSVASQNPNYTWSDENSFGSYLDSHEIYVLVAVDATKDDPDTWILEDTVPAGQYRRFRAGSGEDGTGTDETGTDGTEADGTGAETEAEAEP